MSAMDNASDDHLNDGPDICDSAQPSQSARQEIEKLFNWDLFWRMVDAQIAYFGLTKKEAALATSLRARGWGVWSS